MEMEAFLAGLNNLMDPHVLIAIALGSIGGLMIGAVPGIGPAIAIAILLPATVFLEDLVSLVLLLGVYGASMYGGLWPMPRRSLGDAFQLLRRCWRCLPLALICVILARCSVSVIF